MTVWLEGEALSVKSGGLFTTSATVVVCVRAPLTPVIVSVYVTRRRACCSSSPRGLMDVVAGFGVKLPLAPLGNPLTLRVTWPLKPACRVDSDAVGRRAALRQRSDSTVKQSA